ncbi:hypothetical protein OUZ56_015237 [Daphnia magna]|uniref:Uncharacterized protein n=1 Tax=Daphnia magna TaxID=35525 RepID=A0ABR0AM79_9CRUS|nr:hypothetical protein OUZ56_015237 [Daphnia magna]
MFESFKSNGISKVALSKFISQSICVTRRAAKVNSHEVGTVHLKRRNGQINFFYASRLECNDIPPPLSLLPFFVAPLVSANWSTDKAIRGGLDCCL